jgi:uncharacterized membrane protein YedE/YeeE
MRLIAQFLIGLVFGLGLVISGMTQPAKVQGFLDVAGLWDPSLAFVMAGAIGVAFLAFRFAAGRGASLFGDPIAPRRFRPIDRPLVLGAAIFGVGWGLSGVCPGPAIVNLAFFEPHAIVFAGAMIAGMALERFVAGARSAGRENADSACD